MPKDRIDGVLSLLGLGVRAGTVVIGSTRVRAGVKADDVVLVVIPDDASERTHAKVVRVVKAAGIGVIRVPTAARLGKAVGREKVQAVGVRDRRLAEGIWAKVHETGVAGKDEGGI